MPLPAEAYQPGLRPFVLEVTSKSRRAANRAKAREPALEAAKKR